MREVLIKLGQMLQSHKVNVLTNHINILVLDYQLVMAQVSCVREEKLCKLQIMSPKGDDPVFYNPKNEADLSKVIKTIVEFLNKDYILYGVVF